jgi:hypothetical protein
MQYCYYDIVGTNADFQVHTFVNNFNDCIGLCDTVNVVGQSTECKACSYDYSQVIDYLDCWLKNGTNYLELDSVSNPPAGDYSVIAILL